MRENKGRAIGYWITTGLLALDFFMGGVTAVLRVPMAVAGMEHLGYPIYFGVLLGVWKILGAVAILLPRTPRLKEWAYAGIFFDVTGACVSVLGAGDPPSHALLPLIFVGITVASWALRP